MKYSVNNFLVNMIQNEDIPISTRILHGGVLNPK